MSAESINNVREVGSSVVRISDVQLAPSNNTEQHYLSIYIYSISKGAWRMNT